MLLTLRARALFVFLAFLSFAALLPTPVALASTSAFRGDVSSIVSCSNPLDFYFTVGTTTDGYVFKANSSQSIPRGYVLKIGDPISGVVTASTTCTTSSGSSAVERSGKLVTYYGVTIPVTPPPTQGGGAIPPSSGGGNFQSILDTVQSIFNGVFQPPTTTGGSGVTTPSGTTNPTAVPSTTGSPASPFNFGGMISASVPCDPTSSNPPGPGTFMITIGPPLGGLYMYAPPPISKSYLCLPPPVAVGQNTTGSYTPGGVCDVCLSPETFCPVPTIGIMNPAPGHGTSGCAVPVQPPPKPAPPPADCTEAICAAANSSIGMSSFGAENTNSGRLACAWAVNRVLVKAGVAPADGLNVGNMEDALRSGRGTPVSQSEAQCGDIVVQAGRHHVGICLNAGCTRVVSNSSSRAKFDWFSGIDFLPSYRQGPGRIYRVQCNR